jgi:hypothetical protein
MDPNRDVYGAVFTVAIQAGGQRLATVVVASPHPTCLGPEDRMVSADYPGVVQRKVEAESKGLCMFLAGAVGSMGPAEEKPGGPLRAEDVGHEVFKRTKLPESSAGRFTGSAALSARLLEVDLPPQQYMLTQNLRLSPFAASYLHGRETYVHVLRLNDLVFLGMPCDYSGELAAELEKALAGTPLVPVVTGFNGDYIGYVLPQRRYAMRRYETRDMSLFGPWCGEYLNDVSRRLVKRCSAAATPEAGAGLTVIPDAP